MRNPPPAVRILAADSLQCGRICGKASCAGLLQSGTTTQAGWLHSSGPGGPSQLWPAWMLTLVRRRAPALSSPELSRELVQVLIGRLDSNTLIIPDTEVSSHHVSIRWDPIVSAWQVRRPPRCRCCSSALPL